MEKPVKILVCFCLVLLIFVIGFFTYINREKFFMNVVKITYPDECVEEYKNGELVSDICEEGRKLADEFDKREENFLPDIKWNQID